MPTAYTVRAWTDADTVELAEWFRLDPQMWAYVGFRQPPTVGELELHVIQRMTQEIDGCAALRAVQDTDGTLVGYVSLFPRMASHSVCHIIVAPWMRGRGTAIAQAAIAAAKAAGVTRLVAPLPSYFPEATAKRWLQRLGFDMHYYGEMSLNERSEV